jgi:hypothetical protein
LRQVFGDFYVSDALVDMGIDAGVVFGNQWAEGFGVAGLCAVDEVGVFEC